MCYVLPLVHNFMVKAKYYDVLERTLYNESYFGRVLDGGGFFYLTRSESIRTAPAPAAVRLCLLIKSSYLSFNPLLCGICVCGEIRTYVQSVYVNSTSERK